MVAMPPYVHQSIFMQIQEESGSDMLQGYASVENKENFSHSML